MNSRTNRVRFGTTKAVVAALVLVLPCCASPSSTPSDTAIGTTSAAPAESLSPDPTTDSPSATPASIAPGPAAGYVAIDGLPITVLANADADALFNTVQTCISGAGYTIEFPGSWYTNPAMTGTPACSWFAPEPFDLSIRPVAVKAGPPDGVWISLGVVDGGAGYTSLTPIYLSENVTLGGYEGQRAEFGPSTGDEIATRPDYRGYWYLIPFAEFGPTFIAETTVDLADDYPLAKAVLDRTMASITFQDS